MAEAGRQYTWAWALGALIVVAAFLVWLGLASEPTSVQVVEEEREESEFGGATVTTVEPRALAEAPADYAGQELRLIGVPVASLVGEQAFWVNLPFQDGEIPYLIKADSTALAADVQVQPGQHVTVVGTVREMTDSIMDAWTEQGAITSEGQRVEIGFADSFVEARALRQAAAPRGTQPAAPADTAAAG